MDVYETGQDVLHGCLNACLAFIFALAQNFWHTIARQYLSKATLHWSMKKGRRAGPPPFSLWRQREIQMGIMYCLSNLKSLFASAIWLSTNRVFQIHFSLVLPISLST